jgi:hypothetical protein
MYHRGVSVQDAIDSTGQMVRDASVKILDAENRLYADANAKVLPTIKKFIEGIKHIVLYCLQHPFVFSTSISTPAIRPITVIYKSLSNLLMPIRYSSQRYLKHGVVQEDGSIIFKMNVKTAERKGI